MVYQTLLFDLDGTLTDPLLGIARSLNYALDSFGFAVRCELELSAYIGPPLEDSLLDLTGRNDKALVEAMVAKYRERYLDVGYKENTLYSGVVESLQQLQKEGVRMALCTAKPEATAALVLQLFDLQDFFEFISGGDIGVRKWMQIEALLTSGDIHRNTLMIGDRGVDLQAAHRNGVAAGAVLWGYGSKNELLVESPEHWFSRPSEWVRLLDC